METRGRCSLLGTPTPLPPRLMKSWVWRGFSALVFESKGLILKYSEIRTYGRSTFNSPNFAIPNEARGPGVRGEMQRSFAALRGCDFFAPLPRLAPKERARNLGHKKSHALRMTILRSRSANCQENEKKGAKELRTLFLSISIISIPTAY
jgi:hypothetical protein